MLQLVEDLEVSDHLHVVHRSVALHSLDNVIQEQEMVEVAIEVTLDELAEDTPLDDLGLTCSDARLRHHHVTHLVDGHWSLCPLDEAGC